MPRPVTRFQVELLQSKLPARARSVRRLAGGTWFRVTLAVAWLGGIGTGAAWWLSTAPADMGPQQAWADVPMIPAGAEATLAFATQIDDPAAWSPEPRVTVPAAQDALAVTDDVMFTASDAVSVQIEIDPGQLLVDADAGMLMFGTPEAESAENPLDSVVTDPTESDPAALATIARVATAVEDSDPRTWRAGGGLLRLDEDAIRTSPAFLIEEADDESKTRRDRSRSPRGVTPTPASTSPARSSPTPTLSTPIAVPNPSVPSAQSNTPPASLSPSTGTPPAAMSELIVEAEAEPEAEPEVPETTRPFTMWNALLFNDPPAHVSENPDFPILHVVYGAHIWHSADEDHSYAREDRIRAIARSIEPGTTVCYDIEHWRMKVGSDTFEQELQNFLDIVRWTKEENPTLQVGFYSMLPELRPDVAQLPETHPRWDEFYALIESRQPLIEAVDVIFPWLYTMIDVEDIDQWELWAEKSVRESRRIAPGKPVYPFLWFRYHQIYRERSF
ncbi:MAG: hypothetical protein AAF328_05180, partial [Planctomycetota bacterium]